MFIRTLALTLLSVLPAAAGTGDALARVLAEAAALGLIAPDILLVNGAENQSRGPVDGSIVTTAQSPDPQAGYAVNTLATDVIGAMNDGRTTLQTTGILRGVAVNSASNAVDVGATISVVSQGPAIAIGASQKTSAIGAMNGGMIRITVEAP